MKLLFALFLTFPTFLFSQTGTWGVTYLPEPASNLVAATSLSKVFFLKPGAKKLFVFNSITETWYTDSIPTELIPNSITSIGSKVFITCDSITSCHPSKRIHVFDQLTNTWSIKYLSLARNAITYGKIDNKLYFIAGTSYGAGPMQSSCFNYPTSTIDVYDTLTNNWSVINMQLPRLSQSSFALKNTIFIAGGLTNSLGIVYGQVESYNVLNSNWATHTNTINSTSTDLAGIGNLVFLNYGFSNQNGMPTNNCEIFDFGTNQWTTQFMNYSRSRPKSITGCNDVFFGGDNKFLDVYHLPTNSFYIDSLSLSRSNYCLASVNDKVIFAGGNISGGTQTNQVDIFYEQCATITVKENAIQQKLSIFPNPCSNLINIENNFTIDKVEVFDMLGKEVKSIKNINSKHIEINTSELKQGVYLFKIGSENLFEFKKVNVINSY